MNRLTSIAPPGSLAGIKFGSVGDLMLMGGAAVGIAAVVLLVNGWLRWQHARRPRYEAEPDSVEACPAYRRYLVAAAWAGGSTRDWDYAVRPVLAELVELAIAERQPGAGDPRALAAQRLGPALWPLVDREGNRSEDRESAGAGRAALQRILDQVEAP